MSPRLGERLREERERLGHDQRKFAALGGVSRNTQIAYEQGTTSPTAEYLNIIAESGADAAYILTGSRTFDSPAAPFLVDALDRYGKNMIADMDMVPVNEIDLAFGLGGTYSDVSVETQPRYFPRAWLESITHTSPAFLTWSRGRGDSMSPTINDGDLVLFDLSHRTIREQDAIWALTIGDIAMIKRIRVKGPTVSILSDNDRVPADEVHHEEVNVVGRVVFIGRRL